MSPGDREASFSRGTMSRNDIAQTVFLGHSCVRGPLRLLRVNFRLSVLNQADKGAVFLCDLGRRI